MECEKCAGAGYCPKWLEPYTVLPVGVIQRIRDDAPKCDRCNGTGQTSD